MFFFLLIQLDDYEKKLSVFLVLNIYWLCIRQGNVSKMVNAHKCVVMFDIGP